MYPTGPSINTHTLYMYYLLTYMYTLTYVIKENVTVHNYIYVPCNFEIAPRKLEISNLRNYLYTAQSTAQFVNYLPMEQAFANEARERLS